MFGKLFRKRDNDDWSDSGIATAKKLLELADSNKVVAAELDLFDSKSMQNSEELESQAVASAKALSGYGIAVSKSAFIEYFNTKQS